MKQLHDWLERKIRARRFRLRVPARATEIFRRHTGPRYLFGQVTLSAVLANEFGYLSRVTWPAGEQIQLYEDCVLEGIFAKRGSELLCLMKKSWLFHFLTNLFR